MIRIWREPEVSVRSDGDSLVQSAGGLMGSALADMVRLEPPLGDSFWLFYPQMNGYNVHDGVCDEVLPVDL